MGDPKEHLLQTFANAITNYYEETGNSVLEVTVDWMDFIVNDNVIKPKDLAVKVEL